VELKVRPHEDLQDSSHWLIQATLAEDRQRVEQPAQTLLVHDPQVAYFHRIYPAPFDWKVGAAETAGKVAASHAAEAP
jgi:hypothetical protein